MRQVKISWIDQDISTIELSPMDRLMSLAELSSKTPPDEPWLPIIHPTSRTKRYYLIAISLDSYNRFSDDLIEEFTLECQEILEDCDPIEICEMRTEEISKGNPGELFLAEERLLRLLVPSRFLADVKNRILHVFQRIAGKLTEKASGD